LGEGISVQKIASTCKERRFRNDSVFMLGGVESDILKESTEMVHPALNPPLSNRLCLLIWSK